MSLRSPTSARPESRSTRGGRASWRCSPETPCLLSPTAFGAATETVLDKLSAPGLRIGVASPKVDPVGDYAVRLFATAESLRPGDAAALQARAVVLDIPHGLSPPKSGDTDAARRDRVEKSIVYCSGRDRYARVWSDTKLVIFLPRLQVGPEYALAVLKDVQSEALMLAPTILSAAGQKILAGYGIRPVALPSEQSRRSRPVAGISRVVHLEISSPRRSDPRELTIGRASG